MHRILSIIVALVSFVTTVAAAPAAGAAETVTYEVTSYNIDSAEVEYYDIAGRQRPGEVPLPWRINAAVVNPKSSDAEIRANWRPARGVSKWLTVRIYYRGSMLCENTLDLGSTICEGTPRHIG
ncbi:MULTISPECIES: hypothetical protein [Mycobacterium avium complex (MAC)]|uniref:hypothetical protein n=1 Tax=Mycobacterium avium complex (MAC) TaxID=120793 RepID=UPI000A6E4777|nr:hypothetical protein [Mycobacterium intracellulare]MEE3801514.1 hypothetical protein [Mycobacterium intracellulare]WVL05479.1 hypothetical protein KN247_25655 [Mycobacterium intracellulare]BCO70357.1 hypothetical protein MINTM007_49680 [Mycobacterium intracellulare]